MTSESNSVHNYSTELDESSWSVLSITSSKNWVKGLSDTWTIYPHFTRKENCTEYWKGNVSFKLQTRWYYCKTMRSHNGKRQLVIGWGVICTARQNDCYITKFGACFRNFSRQLYFFCGFKIPEVLILSDIAY